MKVCHTCLRELPFETRVLRSDECPWCLAPVHCCKNCEFHDPGAHNQCHEVGTETVRDREARNFCGSFRFLAGARDGESEADAAKKKLDSLFNF